MPIGNAIGDFGSQVGEASLINQDYAAKKQEMQIQSARQKLADLMAPLQIQELQQKIKELGQPRAEGIISTAGGGQSGVTFQGGKYSTQPLTQGADPKAIKAQISGMAAKAPPEYQAALEGLASSLDNGADPIKTLDEANKLMGAAAGKETANLGKTKFKIDSKDGIITDAQGKPWSFYDPELPPELKNLVETQRKREREEDTKKAQIEATKNAQVMARALALGQMQEAKKAYDAVFKAATRGAAGHSFLKTVEDQVEAARANGGAGTTSGDLTLIEGYMQLMFGADPKALRGSPQMQQQLLQQGGVDDQAIAWWNKVKSGGRLDQAVRDQILDASRTQVGSFDQYVNTTGQLVDDPNVQKLTRNYNNRVAQTGSSQAPAKKNDITDLGGTPAVGPN